MKILAIDRQLEDYLRIPMEEEEEIPLFDSLVDRYALWKMEPGEVKDVLEAILQAQYKAKVNYKPLN